MQRIIIYTHKTLNHCSNIIEFCENKHSHSAIIQSSSVIEYKKWIDFKVIFILNQSHSHTVPSWHITILSTLTNPATLSETITPPSSRPEQPSHNFKPNTLVREERERRAPRVKTHLLHSPCARSKKTSPRER